MGPERRRSERIQRAFATEIIWHSGEGVYVREMAETENISTHGALLRMKRDAPVTHAIAVRAAPAGAWHFAQVKRSHGTTPDGWTQVAIDLAEPSEAFWGVSFSSSL